MELEKLRFHLKIHFYQTHLHKEIEEIKRNQRRKVVLYIKGSKIKTHLIQVGLLVSWTNIAFIL